MGKQQKTPQITKTMIAVAAALGKGAHPATNAAAALIRARVGMDCKYCDGIAKNAAVADACETIRRYGPNSMESPFHDLLRVVEKWARHGGTVPATDHNCPVVGHEGDDENA